MQHLQILKLTFLASGDEVHDRNMNAAIFGTYNVQRLGWIDENDSANRNDNVLCIWKVSPLDNVPKVIKIKSLRICVKIRITTHSHLSSFDICSVSYLKFLLFDRLMGACIVQYNHPLFVPIPKQHCF